MIAKPNRRIYGTVVVLWLTLSVSSVVIALLTWIQLSEQLQVASNAVAIQTAAERVLRELVDCETGMRGFTITGDEQFLGPLESGSKELPKEFARLIELTRNDSAALARAVELRAQSELIMNRIGLLVRTRRDNGEAATAEIIKTGEGRKMMDRMRAQVTEICQMRSTIIEEQGNEARSKLRRASLTSILAGFIGVGAGIFAFWLSRMTLRQQTREKELIEAKLTAEQTSREKTIFLANMSHEIRTPMNAILGFTELLQGELGEPRHRQYLQSIRTSAGSLLQLINDILDMSKIEAGVLELRLEPTDPRDVCKFIHTVFNESAAKKGVELKCIIAENLPHVLLLDRIRLRQILVNLVGNAVKFTDRGNIEVRVNWEKDEADSQGTLLLEIQDTGVGIPPDRLEAIFRPFVQAGANREKESQGTGLGLAIVQRLTLMMGGTVTAASVPGEGSAFSVRIPRVAISSRLPTADEDAPLGELSFDDLTPATLLVVDDNETNCQLVAGMFAGTQHRIVFGATGQEAIDRVLELRPDVILLDIRMPEMDGWEALKRIRNLPGCELIPIVAVTASSLRIEETNLRKSFSGYIRKPFSKRQLFIELSHFLPSKDQTKIATVPAEKPKVPANVKPNPELLKELERLQSTEWRVLCDTMAINEVKRFAGQLTLLGKRWECEHLTGYSEALALLAETYAVADLEIQLKEFSSLVENLRRLAR